MNVAIYEKTYLDMSVCDLKINTLYKCRRHTGALVDSFIVSHKEKIVYGFQSSSKTPKERDVSYLTFFNFMNKLQMFTHGYKLNYIYCYDNSTGNSTGLVPKTFEDTQKKINTWDNIDEEKKMSMNENEKLVKDNLTIYLARVHYYPHCSEIILNKRN